MFFIPSVKATSISDYTLSLKYSDELSDNISGYSSKIDLILDYIENQNLWCNEGTNYCYSVNGGYVLPIIDMSTINTDNVLVYISNASFTDDTNAQRPNVSTIWKSGGYVSERRLNLNLSYKSFTFNFSNGVISNTTYNGNGGKNFAYNISNDLNPTTSDIILSVSDYYYYSGFLNDTSYIKFNIDTSLPNNYYSIPIHTDTTDYVAPTQIISKNFFNSFVSETNPNLCTVPAQIGETTNVSSITFRVTGFTNSLDYPLEGFVDLISQDELNLSNNVDWSTFVNVQVNEGPDFDEDVTVDYDVSYNYDTQTLHFYFNATTEDDVDSYVDVLFTLGYNDVLFKPFFTSRLYIFACQPYGGVLSYAYRDDTTGMTNSTDTTLLNFLGNGSSSNWPGLFNFIKNYPKGPVDSILTMPLDILNSLLNKFSTNTCSPLVLNLPYVNRNITLPCINTLYSQINGLDVFLNWFSALFSAFLLYKYFIFLYKWVDDILTFRENNHFGGI